MKYYCLFFSRGCCPYGYECEYLHTLPTNATLLPDNSKDCFAREKFSDYRDDMGGVGTFTRQNRTLYVGRVKEVGTGEETEETVRRHFKEWGVIEKSTSSIYSSCVRMQGSAPHFCTLDTHWFSLSILRSPCPPIPKCGIRDLRQRIQRSIRQRSYGLSISRQ